MLHKNINIIFVVSLSLLIGRTNTWGLDITAQAQSSSNEEIGISDYIRIKMQAAEPFLDCGIDRCCDKFENGLGSCLESENPNYLQGDDPNGDNYHPLYHPNGYEKNGKWDGDIFNDENQNCKKDSLEIFGIIQQDGITILDRVGTNFEPDGIFQEGEIFINLDENGECIQTDNECEQLIGNPLDVNYDGLVDELDYPSCRYEEGGTDGWRQGEDEFDIPAPMDGHTNIRFSHLEWMNQTDINGNTCCMEGIYFSVDKRSWKEYDEVSQWDIYGNTWQLGGNVDKIKFSWEDSGLDTLFWLGDNEEQNPYEIYIFSDTNFDGKFNSDDTYVNMNTSQYFEVDPAFLVPNGEGARLSIVLGECALEGTDEYAYDNDGDGWADINCLDCPKEFCPGSFTGDYYAICESEFCINDPNNQQYIYCPENFSFDRVLNERGIDIDIENNTLSDSETSYPGGGDGIDSYLTVCKYNEEIKFSECGLIRDEFNSEGNNEDWLFLDHDCGPPNDNSPEECELFYDGEGMQYHINTNVWIQKWYRLDEIIEEDTNDAIYCETNAVDYCNVCATTDIIGLCEGTENTCSNDSDCTNNNECISDGIFEDFNEDLDCNGICFGPAEIDDCGICQNDVIFGNFKSTYENFIQGPDVDCNGECRDYTPTYELKHEQGNTKYGNAKINSCGICTGGNTIHPNWDCNTFDENECENISNCDDDGWCSHNNCIWDNIINECTKNNASVDYNGIDECSVCPPISNAEPFFDEPNNQGEYNGIWDEGEEYLDLISDGIFTSINSEYFYGEHCWDDEPPNGNGNGEWDDEDEYTDTNNNGQYDCYEYNNNGDCIDGEPTQDPDGDGYTPAEPFKLPGECLQIDLNYTYGLGANCDGECFNYDYTLYSEAFRDDCGSCSCLNGAINDENNFCSNNHFPNSGDSEIGTDENPNSCLDSIFYDINENNELLISIQNFTALSNPATNPDSIDKVILEWEYNPEIYVQDAQFIIHQFFGDSTSIIDTTFNPTCIVNDENDYYGTCSTGGLCIASNYGNDCNIIHFIDSTTTGTYGIEIFDTYNHGSGILDSISAVEFYNIQYDLFHGNNLISFYSLPENKTLEYIFSPIQDYVTGIIGQGQASSHQGNGDWVGVINEINGISGYWLKIDYIGEDGSLNDTLHLMLNETYPVPKDQIYELQSGANLISYVGLDNLAINLAINDNYEHYFRSIIGEGVAASQQDLNNDNIPDTWVGNLFTLNLKKGYWIILNLDGCYENGDCTEDNWGNDILHFNWE